MSRRWWALALVLEAGCSCRDEPPAAEEIPLEEVCLPPETTEAVAWGDANHDGQLDVADGVYALRWLMQGGPPPACEAAQNLLEDDLVDLVDGLGIFYHLFVGDFAIPARKPDCGEPTPMEPAPCGRLGVAIGAPDRVEATSSGATFDGEVWLRSPDLALQAWSFGIAAEGCEVTATTEAGTAIADVRLDPAGQRDVGFVRVDLKQGGVTQGAVVSWEKDLALAPRDEPWKVLAFTVSADPPASGCSACTLTLVDDLRGAGKQVARVAVARGRSYPLPAVSTTIEICAP
jgi:hypothetical protein